MEHPEPQTRGGMREMECIARQGMPSMVIDDAHLAETLIGLLGKPLLFLHECDDSRVSRFYRLA